MAGGALEVHRDDTPFAFGTHKGVNGAVNLYVKGADFKSCGVQTGVLIKNLTKGSSGTISSVTEDTIASAMAGGTISAGGFQFLTGEDGKVLTGEDGESLTDDGTFGQYWDTDDEYEIYLTATEDSVISSIWTDKRFGRKSYRKDLQRGLRPEDVDLDEYESHIFGPGQPQKARM